MNVSRVKTVLFVNLKLCVHEILANRTRTFITTLGIFLAVTSLLVNLAFIRGMDDDLKENMERIGGLDIIKVKAVDAVTREEKVRFQRSPGLSIQEAQAAARALPYINGVLLYKDLSWQRFAAQGERSWGKMLAVDTQYLALYNYDVAYGRTITSEDMKRRNYVCIIGKRLAERLFELPENAVGKSITIRHISLRVIGVIQTESFRNQRANECLIPFVIYAQRFRNATRNLGEVSFALTSSEFVRQAQRELGYLYQSLHRGAKDFEIEASLDKIKEMEIASAGVKIIFWAIAFISIVVGGISIMNIMFATIGDRIREIGIRKALGAQPYDIFTQFIIEAVSVCFVGGAPGMFIGTLITYMPKGIFPYIPRLEWIDFVVAVAFTLLSGIFSGLFPALKAARLQPVEALQY